MGIQKRYAFEIVKILKNGKKRTRILFETPELAQAYIDTYKKGKNYTYEIYEFPHVYGTLEDIEQDILLSSLSKKMKTLQSDMIKLDYPIVCEKDSSSFEIDEFDYDTLFNLLKKADEYLYQIREGESYMEFPYSNNGEYLGIIRMSFNEYKNLVQIFFDRKLQIMKKASEIKNLTEAEPIALG